MQPLISVIMPVYNAAAKADLLDIAVGSILAQTEQNFELILIDDLSTDNTGEILQAYAAKDARIKLVKNTRGKGIGGALNSGLEVATGEFIARHDADDISTPDRFARQVAYLKHHPEAVAVGCQLTIIDDNGQVVGKKSSPTDSKTLRGMIFKYLPMPHPALMLRASGAKNCRYPEDYPTSEDVPFYFQLLKQGEFGNEEGYLYQYRISESSNSFRQIKKSLYYTIKGRWDGITKYGFLPGPMGVFYTLLQASLLILPGKVINQLYKRLRLAGEDESNGSTAVVFELVRYAIVGVLTVLIDWGSYLFIQRVIGVDYLLADILNLPIFLS